MDKLKNTLDKLLTGMVMITTLTLPIWGYLGGIYLDKHMPKYDCYPSKNGNIGITINGQITKGPYKGKSIDQALYEAIFKTTKDNAKD